MGKAHQLRCFLKGNNFPHAVVFIKFGPQYNSNLKSSHQNQKYGIALKIKIKSKRKEKMLRQYAYENTKLSSF